MQRKYFNFQSNVLHNYIYISILFFSSLTIPIQLYSVGFRAKKWIYYIS